jgi:hypothetical protein
MTPIGPNQTRIEAQHRVILIIWVFMFMSVVGFLVMTVLIPSNAQGDNRVLAFVLIGLSLLNLVISFIIKRSFLAQSVEKQDLSLVSKAYIVALALCESAGLFGLLIHFAAGSVYYYVPFVIAVVGMLLHFPKKQHLLDASFKQL